MSPLQHCFGTSGEASSTPYAPPMAQEELRSKVRSLDMRGEESAKNHYFWANEWFLLKGLIVIEWLWGACSGLWIQKKRNISLISQVIWVKMKNLDSFNKLWLSLLKTNHFLAKKHKIMKNVKCSFSTYAIELITKNLYTISTSYG